MQLNVVYSFIIATCLFKSLEKLGVLRILRGSCKGW